MQLMNNSVHKLLGYAAFSVPPELQNEHLYTLFQLHFASIQTFQTSLPRALWSSHAALSLGFRFHVQGCIFLNIFHMLRLVLVGQLFLTSHQRPTFCFQCFGVKDHYVHNNPYFPLL